MSTAHGRARACTQTKTIYGEPSLYCMYVVTSTVHGRPTIRG